MDWWQRNKDFAIRVGGAVMLFLVALIVRGCVYPDNPTRQQAAIDGAQRRIKDRRTPTPSSALLRDLNRRIDALEQAVARDASTVGELRRGDELRRATIESVLRRIGRGDPATVNEYLQIARSSPSACFARIYDDVRNHYRRVAIEMDIPISEDLGFAETRFGEADVLRAFHALSLVTRAVDAAVQEAGVESVDKVVVRLGTKRGAAEAADFIDQDRVEFTVRANAAAMMKLINSLNDPKRFVPIREVTVGGRKSAATRYQTTVQVSMELRAVRIDLGTEEES